MKRRTTKRPRERVPAEPEARPVAPAVASSLLVIVDPRPLTRQSLGEMLGRTLSDFNVIAVSSCDELMSGTGRPGLKPGLILLNPSLGGAGGEWTRNALKWLKRWLPTVPVIVLSDRDAPEELDELLDLGVRGYLPPSAEPAVVFAAVRLVHAGYMYSDPPAWGSAQGGAQAPWNAWVNGAGNGGCEILTRWSPEQGHCHRAGNAGGHGEGTYPEYYEETSGRQPYSGGAYRTAVI